MWTPLTDPPKESGKYIVAHRGHAEIFHYLHPDGDYLPQAKLGWQGDVTKFGATHYQPLEDISYEEDDAAEDHWQELVTNRNALQEQVAELESRIAMKRHTWKEGEESGERILERESRLAREMREQEKEVVDETD